jgi:hypothetical protein
MNLGGLHEYSTQSYTDPEQSEEIKAEQASVASGQQILKVSKQPKKKVAPKTSTLS